MSEDWIPVPEIEKVLIIIAELSDDADALAEAPAMKLLNKLKNWSGGSVYVFHNPPEAGEILEDVDAEMATEFALAAQMSDIAGEVCRDALRRIFSRAVVQRVVLVKDDAAQFDTGVIDSAFTALAEADLAWAGEWPSSFIAGFREFYPEIFSDVDAPDYDLRNRVAEVARARALQLSILVE